MNQHTFTRYPNGFIIGIILGLLLIVSGTILYNLFSGWKDCIPMAYFWWDAIPLPLLMGIGSAFFVANYTLRD